jgi:methyl-accepting chemotaxis protein
MKGPKFLSLQTKLILCFVITSIVIVIATIGPALYLTSENIYKMSEEEALQGMQGLNSILEDYKKDALLQGSFIAAHPEVTAAVQSKDTQRILAVMTPWVKQANLDFATITDNRGVVLARTHAPEKKGDTVNNQFNVRSALQGVATAAIEPGTEIKLSVRAGIPIKNAQGDVLGVISVGYAASKAEAVDQAKSMFGTEATLFLNDVRVSTTIVKDGERVVGTKLNEAIATKVLTEGQRYVGIADILGKQYITAYMPLAGPEGKPVGVIFAGKPYDQATAARNELILAVSVITVVVLVLSLITGTVIARKISNPIKALGKATSQVASGDLSEQITVNTNDEIGILADSFNMMVSQLKQLITKVTSLSQSLAASSQELTASADESAQAANQVAASITEVATSSERQLNSVNSTALVVKEITDSIDKIAGKALSVADTSKQTATAAKDGGQAIATAVEQMGKIEATVTQSAAKVGKLGERSDEIGNIVETIATIAGQTNLLALNAAVEAARAGELGRGFAVVAEEIRKLAEESQIATERISALIADIRQDTGLAVHAMEEGTNQVTVGSKVVGNAGQAFVKIVALVDNVTAQISDISAAIRQIAGNSQKIISSVNEIEEASKHSSVEAQTVSAATEEQSAAMEQMAAATQSLAKMAEDLQNTVAIFKV